MMATVDTQIDTLITTLTDYIYADQNFSENAYRTASYCLLDSLGCGLLALNYSACTKLLGPIIEGTMVPNGIPIFGTHWKLDPMEAAFNIGTLIRWLDYNDTWLAAEWGHPSDNLGAILAIALYKKNLSIHDVLTCMIKAYEIQGILALTNSLNRLGFDHVFYVKLASAAIAAWMLSNSKEAIKNTLSQVFVDGLSLRTYRHAPNTGSRKSWAAGDATRRGAYLAWLTSKGEMGYQTPLTAPRWGFNHVILKDQELNLSQPLASYVMENILFKISFPAEFHAQTAVECAIALYPKLKNHWDSVQTIKIKTHDAAMRIINKTGPLHNPADRDHCLQYMVAVGLLLGELKADHYENEFARKTPILDKLREKMQVEENATFSHDYLDPSKRSIANSIEITFNDGKSALQHTVEYPIGHARRREEGIPLLIEKFKTNAATRFQEKQIDTIIKLFNDKQRLFDTAVNEFIKLFDCL